MFNGVVRKCFKVSSIKERNLIKTEIGDVVYIRNHPSVYLKISDNEFKKFNKIYVNKKNPKYNMNNINSLEDPYLFKIDHFDNLEAVPAKTGDLIYRDGDTFMYQKQDEKGLIVYKKILKI